MFLHICQTGKSPRFPGCKCLFAGVLALFVLLSNVLGNVYAVAHSVKSDIKQSKRLVDARLPIGIRSKCSVGKNQNDDSVDRQLLCLVNVCRANCGKDPLLFNDFLKKSATNHNNLMVKFDKMSHHLPGELGLLERAMAVGYPKAPIGENVAKGFNNTQSVMKGWIDSKPHFDGLNGDYTHVGFASRDMFWTQNFGKLPGNHNKGKAYKDNCTQFQDQDGFDIYDIATQCANKCGVTYAVVPPNQLTLPKKNNYNANPIATTSISKQEHVQTTTIKTITITITV
ncbi:hypothetical protein H4219_004020 [Mycoemilia scoparia]|uniref:SCP domain-containing protein n=1 Tax=Mycoemilia scoparia TaxID=417184 RepID=A0A9W7ZZK7_9FUNG|nr:hypothetical protein H4219_004020 [Mycoemilia scoparia]